MEKVNIILGKFQPFTVAHKQLINELYKANGYKVVIFIGEPKQKDKNHPFSTEILIKEIKSIYDDNIVLCIRPYRGGDFKTIFDELKSLDYEPQLWGCGSDRVESYNRFINNYREKLSLPKCLKIYELHRNDEDISATKVREAIKNNDFKTYFYMMPIESHNMFNEFKENYHE